MSALKGKKRGGKMWSGSQQAGIGAQEVAAPPPFHPPTHMPAGEPFHLPCGLLELWRWGEWPERQRVSEVEAPYPSTDRSILPSQPGLPGTVGQVVNSARRPGSVQQAACPGVGFCGPAEHLFLTHKGTTWASGPGSCIFTFKMLKTELC